MGFHEGVKEVFFKVLHIAFEVLTPFILQGNKRDDGDETGKKLEYKSFPIYRIFIIEFKAEMAVVHFGRAFKNEIVFIDDCSEQKYRSKNERICKQIGNYIGLNRNIGRAKIRNLFLTLLQLHFLVVNVASSFSHVFIL